MTLRHHDFAAGIGNWTQVALTSGQTDPIFSVVNTDQLQATSVSAHNEALVYNDVDADGDRANFEILCQVFVDSTSTTQRYLAGRISTSGSSRNGYALRVRSNSIDVYRFSGSTYTSEQGATISIASAWAWVRWRIHDNLAYAKIWTGAEEDEPSSWNLDAVSVTTYNTAGHIGVLKGANTNTQLWRYFNLATGGDTASMPSGGAIDGVVAAAEVIAPSGSPSGSQTQVGAVAAAALLAAATAPSATQAQPGAVPAGTVSTVGSTPTAAIAQSGALAPADVAAAASAPAGVQLQLGAVPAAEVGIVGSPPGAQAPVQGDVPAAGVATTASTPAGHQAQAGQVPAAAVLVDSSTPGAAGPTVGAVPGASCAAIAVSPAGVQLQLGIVAPAAVAIGAPPVGAAQPEVAPLVPSRTRGFDYPLINRGMDYAVTRRGVDCYPI